MRRDLDDLTDDMKGVLDKLSDVVTKSEIAPILLELGQPEDKREWLFLNGQPIKAVDAYIKIYSLAQKTMHSGFSSILLMTIMDFLILFAAVEWKLKHSRRRKTQLALQLILQWRHCDENPDVVTSFTR